MIQDGPAAVWQFELYIAGDNRRSVLTLDNFRGICHDYLHGNCHVDVFDVKKRPELIVEKKLAVAPTLIKKYPLPEKVLVGDLSIKEKVLEGLGIDRPKAGSAGKNLYDDGLRKQGRHLTSQHRSPR